MGGGSPPTVALRAIVGITRGDLVSCMRGRLGYFEGEMRQARYILKAV